MRILLSAEQMQTSDRYTQETIGVPSIVLMERAALAVADRIAVVAPVPENGRALRAAVVAGKGNNGADALAVGRILLDRGCEVDSYVCEMTPAPGTNAETQTRILQQYHAAFYDLEEDAALERLQSQYYDVYVDGLFGIGLSREVGGRYAAAIDAMNRGAQSGHSLVMAVDIPSGIDATTGEVLGTAVRANETVTFGFLQRGHLLYPGTIYSGHVTLADIGIPAWSHSGPAWFTYDRETADDLLPLRRADGNKGTNGKAVIVAGGYAMAGAATMAASAAGRMGCGMVKVYTREENRVIMQDTLPECLVSLWRPEDMNGAVEQLRADLQWADTVAVGPGLGKHEQERELVRTVLQHAGEVRHLILDADAIRIIAENNDYTLLAEAGVQSDVILTPHLAECAALLQTTVSRLGQSDRSDLLRQFANIHHVTLLCKDARSIVVTADNDAVYLNTSGNDGLSTAGSGDVLTGILTACCAQGMKGLDAAAAASYLHGRLAEQAEGETGRRGLVAPDIYKKLSAASAVVWSEEFS